MRRILAALTLDAGKVSSFIIADLRELGALCHKLGFELVWALPPPKAGGDLGAKYKSDHMVLFEQYELKWPCSLISPQVVKGHTHSTLVG